jgi:hypothetical protein
MAGYSVLRCVYDFQFHRRDRVPMASCRISGDWNVLFVALRSRCQWNIGLHGAVLPILLAPLGILVTSLLHFSIPGFAAHAFPILAPVALIAYYLVWKYLVSFLNRVVALA